MEKSRRAFVTAAAVTSAGIAMPSMSAAEQKSKPQLIHHVFFWLKNRNSQEDLAKLVEGLRSLQGIETVRKLHIGIPASTKKRDVVDASYSVSELMFFDDAAGQQIYQDHPIHQKFVETCGHLWKCVIVYDSIDI